MKTLKEKAKGIAYDVCKDLPQGEQRDIIIYYAMLAAKAGIEWYRSQGEIIETEVYGWGDDNFPEISVNPEHVKPDDKVIVHIIKKE